MFPLAEILGIGTKLIDKLIPDPEAKAKAQLELAQLAQSGELAKMNADLEAYKVEQDNLTQRLQADMASDSWWCEWARELTSPQGGALSSSDGTAATSAAAGRPPWLE